MKLKYKILELRERGLSYNDIKEQLNCSKSTISYHCSSLDDNDIKEQNILIKNKMQKKDKSFLIENVNVDEIIELRKNKISYSKIKEITNYSINIISKVCREFDLTNNRSYSKITIEDINNINILYSKYKSTRKVALDLNISRESVSKYLNDDNRALLTKKDIKVSKSKAVVDWRKRTKVKLVEYKGGCCCRCGYSKSIGALEFHHLDPSEKDFTISGKSWSFERLKSEVDKCVLVCSNCHIEIHEEIRNSGV